MSFIEWDRNKTCKCPGHLIETEYNSKVCPFCGIENMSAMWIKTDSYYPRGQQLQNAGSYTRVKRFRKYLDRAAMYQSVASVPNATWEYLLKSAPYKGPRDIIRRLKGARGMPLKKCYDCLPLLTKNLCPRVTVPVLTNAERSLALLKFRQLDHAYNNGEPFVSYLYALEYILTLIGRNDVLPFINKIQCVRRRRAYKERLNRIYM